MGGNVLLKLNSLYIKGDTWEVLWGSQNNDLQRNPHEFVSRTNGYVTLLGEKDWHMWLDQEPWDGDIICIVAQWKRER